ncbi:hypothetical protein COEREDRAFT_89835 [Coemansia reversa NRRL 1564]|uniref:Uncharacterized protein n=1 Tax=Coemansia reversa (strain ATCC 12441 / NRRL 1564) TaxID=763665 RepID=A0A2G5B232_COERN|nr:hypothetical protein COEREDRAFT_89835 [Coemansia reversa NRRL 1564]|eukprot:PIA13080.1 hypothetical protein COEREDRAFT_89835 [Coemansia reversa NRRL 1564]
MVAFYCCIIATVLFLVKDGLMSNQELDDVNLCRAAVYMRQTVTPLDEQQLPVIKTGLLLWNLGSAFQLAALGCMMSLWGAVPVRRLLGVRAPMGGRTALAMVALGAVGWVAAVVSHFVSADKEEDTARARSIARIVTSAVFTVFLVVLVWISMKLTRVMHEARRRDPFATAAVVSASQKLHAEGGAPMATLHYLLEMQRLAFMSGAARLLALILMLRVVFFFVFDISFLTPQRASIANLGASNAYSGIATLASSLIAPLIVQVLFPPCPDIVAHQLSMAAEMDPQSRQGFVDAQLRATHAMPRLTLAMSSRDRMLSNATDLHSRSRAPTAASLAVEKLMPPYADINEKSMPPYVNTNEKSMPPHAALQENYLDSIPYIDRDVRENSFFSQGPWSQPVTHSLQPRDSSTVLGARNPQQGPTPQSQRQLEELVRSNTGTSLITIEGRQDMLRQSVLRNNSLLFEQNSGAASRSHVTSSYVPLSSSNPMLTASTTAIHPNTLSSSALTTNTSSQSGPSLHAEALQDSSASSDTNRADSIITSYMRSDNFSPRVRHAFGEGRPSSFVSEDYQYEPITSPNPFATASPVTSAATTTTVARTATIAAATAAAAAAAVSPENSRSEQLSVYIADSAREDQGNDSNDDDLSAQSGVGPILIRKGSKASLRRKGTLERRRQRKGISTNAEDNDTSHSTIGSAATSPHLSDEQLNSEAATTVAAASSSVIPAAVSNTWPKKSQVSRMSAFNGPSGSQPILLNRAQAGSSPGSDEMRRDSATISNMSWDHKTRQTSGNFDRMPPTHPLQTQSNAPSSLFKHPVGSSIGSMSSVVSSAANDAFYTPESSLAQISQQQISTQQSNNRFSVVMPAPPEQSPTPSIHEDRPSTAPSTSQRHTLGFHERRKDPVDDVDEDNSGAGRIRRAHTLRKAVDTDVPAIESSIGNSNGEHAADALISALPMPSQPSGNRFIL